MQVSVIICLFTKICQVTHGRRTVPYPTNPHRTVVRMHKTFVTYWLWLTYVQNILQPSFVGPFDVVGSIGIAYNAYAIIRPWLYCLQTQC